MNNQWEILEIGISQFKGDKNSKFLACGIMILHVAAGVVAGAISYLAFTYSILLGSILYFPLIFFIGTRWRAINNMSHECFHLYFVREKKWNEWYGIVLGIIELGSYYDFREEHATHHRYLGDFNADKDFRGFEKFRFSVAITPKEVLKHLIFSLSLRHIRDYIFVKVYVRRDPLWARFIRITYLIFLIMFAVKQSLAFFAYFVVPFVTIYQIIKYLTDYLDHGGRLNNNEPLNKSRNCYINNPIIRSIAFPRHDCYHLVHHLYPAVPNKKLHEAHNWLLSNWHEYGKLEHSFYKKIVNMGAGIRK